MGKTILGLDLGTTSIGWALVNEATDENETSSIVKLGVRVNPLTTEEQNDFEKGKPITLNADRTLKRGARRNLQRYKQRREKLIEILKQHSIISDSTILSEEKGLHSTYFIRSQATKAKIEKEDFARILLMINKKRGYRSSRKAKNEDEGKVIDGMDIAKRLYDNDLTPGELSYQLLKEGKRTLPDYYRSDLKAEFEKVWNFQKQSHSDILTDDFKKELEGKGQKATIVIFKQFHGVFIAEIKAKTREEKKLISYELRANAVSQILSVEEMAFVIAEINNNIHNSSGYLGEISDRSKDLYFNRETIGEYLYRQLSSDPHSRTKNKVFYRQDYLDEFEKIWEEQSKYHPELTLELKVEVRDVIIFYQRKLKSQKGLIGFCEFESRKIEIDQNGKKVEKTIGMKVVARSSFLFQEFKIWQNLQNLKFKHKQTGEIQGLDLDAQYTVFEELNVKGNLKVSEVLKLIGHSPREWDANYSEIEGNKTQSEFYNVYLRILEQEGYDESWLKDSDKDEIKVSDLNLPASEIKGMVKSIFTVLGINEDVLEFNPDLEGKDFEKQAAYQLWHVLYSYQEDNSPGGNDKLFEILQNKFGFKKQHSQLLANINLQQDYASLSSKAIRKILPYMKAGHPFSRKDKSDKVASATALAGYNHSSSKSREENETRTLKDRLELLPKNSLRNPVVEKILNQMVNVVNAIMDDPALGKPDEIRIELARELKKNASERAEMTSNINKAKGVHDDIRAVLIKEFDIKNPSRNDIIRYKLYNELKLNGFKNIYTNEFIPRDKIFSKEYDVDHIIPQSKLFDDSFSNKTLVPRQINLDKGNKTAFDFISSTFGEIEVKEYVERVESLYKAKEDSIGKAKYQKLLKEEKDIGDGFIERDLRETQYIAKKAKEMLEEVCRTVVSTSGNITEKLREDWGLVNVMQELNFEKYKKLGLTELVERKDGNVKERIKDWSKRNDHRHHAMDALTIAFTKYNYIQYLNYLNARKNEGHKRHLNILAIENKETELVIDENGSKKRKFKVPMPHFRKEAREHLNSILVSYKSKTKVVTKNKNTINTKQGKLIQTALTPRGQLHKETVYGSSRRYTTRVETINAKFDLEKIQMVASKKVRDLLLKRFSEHGNDPQKAFSGKNSLSKNPIYLDLHHKVPLPGKVKIVWLENDYTIRKPINPENFKDLKTIEKVVDTGVRRILKQRWDESGGNPKAAFSDLEKNPIWINQQKGIAIKSAVISGIKNAEVLHFKKDHSGNDILDAYGERIPTDFVSTGNNHHVAIYRDKNGSLQEYIVSFYEAVARVNQGLAVVDKSYKSDEGWVFLFTMKQNEYFIFPADGFDPNEIDLLDENNYQLISPNLFRIQKIATKNYFFRHHLETTVQENKELKDITYKPQLGLNGIEGIVKVRLNHLGKIVKTGE